MHARAVILLSALLLLGCPKPHDNAEQPSVAAETPAVESQATETEPPRQPLSGERVPLVDSPLVGYWEESNGAQTIFRDDATWQSGSGSGTYQLLEGSRVQMKDAELEITAEYKIRGDKLTLTIVAIKGRDSVPPDLAAPTEFTRK
jgi:hypothetical protein